MHFLIIIRKKTGKISSRGKSEEEVSKETKKNCFNFKKSGERQMVYRSWQEENKINFEFYERKSKEIWCTEENVSKEPKRAQNKREIL